MSSTPGHKPPMATTLPGLSHVMRYWDHKHSCYVAKIKPGELYVTKNEEKISTTLGSCIAACIRDPKADIGGMNHFMLPLKGNHYEKSSADMRVSEAMRYGNWSMEYLINEILKNGGKRRNLEIKLFGGSNIISDHGNSVGAENIKFIKDYIYDEDLKIRSEDLGGTHPRILFYDPLTGRVQVKKLPSEENSSIINSEKSYMRILDNKPDESGDLELF